MEGELTARRTAAFALAAVLVTACAHGPRGEQGEEGPGRGPGAQVGIASYYSHALQGRPTASGVPYDAGAMTCAHPTYPFGTMLRVTLLETGRSVLVKVIDRGPFVRDRIIDLSWAAARALGLLGRGLGRVVVERATE